MPKDALEVAAGPVPFRVQAVDWPALEACLWERGYAVTPLLTPGECTELAGLYGRERLFRSRVEMARHRFGEGEYRYFDRPLPALVEALREPLFPPLAAVANRWMEALGEAERFPDSLGPFLARCREAGQAKPTPLLLRYEEGGYNCLHQDLYGEESAIRRALGHQRQGER